MKLVSKNSQILADICFSAKNAKKQYIVMERYRIWPPPCVVFKKIACIILVKLAPVFEN